jgi:4-methylaminobutanoate oxidase (formaldehyde-forming)
MAGLEFALDPKVDFIGKACIAEAGKPEKRLVSITLENETAVPLGNEPVFADGLIIGKTTSAAYGYRVGKPVLLALLDLAYCGAGRSVTVEVAGDSFDGSVKIGAVFDDTKRRMRLQKA